MSYKWAKYRTYFLLQASFLPLLPSNTICHQHSHRECFLLLVFFDVIWPKCDLFLQWRYDSLWGTMWYLLKPYAIDERYWYDVTKIVVVWLWNPLAAEYFALLQWWKGCSSSIITSIQCWWWVLCLWWLHVVMMWFPLQAPVIPCTMQCTCLIATSRWGLTDVM